VCAAAVAGWGADAQCGDGAAALEVLELWQELLDLEELVMCS